MESSIVYPLCEHSSIWGERPLVNATISLHDEFSSLALRSLIEKIYSQLLESPRIFQSDIASKDPFTGITILHVLVHTLSNQQGRLKKEALENGFSHVLELSDNIKTLQEVIKLLITLGAPTNVWDYSRRSPLSYAANCGVTMVRLLSKGTRYDVDERPPLYRSEGQQLPIDLDKPLESLRDLVRSIDKDASLANLGQSSGSSEASQDNQPSTARVARSSDFADPSGEIRRETLQGKAAAIRGKRKTAGFDESTSFETVELLNSKLGPSELFYIKDPDAVKFLIDRGADVNQTLGKKTPLFYHDDVEVLKLLVAAGADITVEDDLGRTPAFYNTGIDTLEVLFDKMGGIYTKDVFGSSILEHAHDAESVRFLYAHGGILRAIDSDNRTPLHKYLEDMEKGDPNELQKLHGIIMAFLKKDISLNNSYKPGENELFPILREIRKRDQNRALIERRVLQLRQIASGKGLHKIDQELQDETKALHRVEEQLRLLIGLLGNFTAKIGPSKLTSTSCNVAYWHPFHSKITPIAYAVSIGCPAEALSIMFNNSSPWSLYAEFQGKSLIHILASQQDTGNKFSAFERFDLSEFTKSAAGLSSLFETATVENSRKILRIAEMQRNVPAIKAFYEEMSMRDKLTESEKGIWSEIYGLSRLNLRDEIIGEVYANMSRSCGSSLDIIMPPLVPLDQKVNLDVAFHRTACIHQQFGLPPFNGIPRHVSDTAGLPEDELDDRVTRPLAHSSDIDATINEIYGIIGIGGIVSSWDGAGEFYVENDTLYIAYSDAQMIRPVVYRIRHSLAILQERGFCCSEIQVPTLPKSDHKRLRVMVLKTISFTSISEFLEAVIENLDKRAMGVEVRLTTDQLRGITSELGFKEITATDDIYSDEVLCLSLQLLAVSISLYVRYYVGDAQFPGLEKPPRCIALLGRKRSRDFIEGPNVATEKHCIAFTRRRLRCLDSFLQGPLWAASVDLLPSNLDFASHQFWSEREKVEPFPLVTTPSQFIDLFGPCLLLRSQDDPKLFNGFFIGGGFVAGGQNREARMLSALEQEWLADMAKCLIPTVQQAVICHWYTGAEWKAIKRDNPELLRANDTLCIGAAIENKDCDVDPEGTRKRSRQFFKILGTHEGYWMEDERQLNIGGGYNLTIGGSRVYKAVKSVTHKLVLLQDWMEGSIRILHAMVGLELSMCTGVARRVPLKHVILQCGDYFEDHAERDTWLAMQDSIHRLLTSDGKVFRDIWSSFDKSAKEKTRKLLGILLEKLALTGVSATGEEFTLWWPHPDCGDRDAVTLRLEKTNEINHRWMLMLRETSECAVFAVVTKTCLEHPQHACQNSPRRHPDRFRWKSRCEGLHTGIIKYRPHGESLRDRRKPNQPVFRPGVKYILPSFTAFLEIQGKGEMKWQKMPEISPWILKKYWQRMGFELVREKEYGDEDGQEAFVK
ncbi:hypothetical protein ABW19_dt0202830 [Dactylella cylindrospora]|nr:hypothetical protein ABW19_dt0202830 [Dactylella cylindrospora]